MDLHGKTIGMGMTAAYAALPAALGAMDALCAAGAEVVPVFSYHLNEIPAPKSLGCDVNTGVRRLCGRPPVTRLEEAQRAAETFDLLLLCPATLDTMARLCRGSAASPPLAAARVVTSRERPVLVAPFVQNGLPDALYDIGRLLLRKHVFLVPFCQDGSTPNFPHLFARTDLVSESVAAALSQRQLQPVLRQRREPF